MEIIPHTPLVTLDWIQESLRSKQCRFPVDYALNYTKIRSSPSASLLKRLNKKMQALMSLDFIQTRAHTTPNAPSSNLLAT